MLKSARTLVEVLVVVLVATSCGLFEDSVPVFDQRAAENNVVAVRAMLEDGADPNRYDGTFTVFHGAATSGAPDTSAILLDAGADPLLPVGPDSEHLVVTMASAWFDQDQGHLDVLRLLVDRGVDICVSPDAEVHGKLTTPQLARSRGNDAFANLWEELCE